MYASCPNKFYNNFALFIIPALPTLLIKSFPFPQCPASGVTPTGPKGSGKTRAAIIMWTTNYTQPSLIKVLFIYVSIARIARDMVIV